MATIAIIEADRRAPEDMPAGTICKLLERWACYGGYLYAGRREDLIAAGLVNADQFPPDGKQQVSFLAGAPMLKNRCKADETYRRIERHERAGWFEVTVGLAADVIAQRKRIEKEREQAERAIERGKERDKALRTAQGALRRIPRTERDFRIKIVKSVREMVRFCMEDYFKPSERHGFMLDEASADDIFMSIDAIVEAIVLAKVACDHAKQTRIVSELQAAVVVSGGGFSEKVAALTQPNPALLQGEAA